MKYIFSSLELLLIIVYSIIIGLGLNGLFFQTVEIRNSLIVISLGIFPLMISILKSRHKKH